MREVARADWSFEASNKPRRCRTSSGSEACRRRDDQECALLRSDVVRDGIVPAEWPTEMRGSRTLTPYSPTPLGP
jgi:hypothetical protein